MPAARYRDRERAAQLATFLKALSRGQAVRAAAASVGFDRRALYRLRSTDPLFAARWQEALSVSKDPPADPLELEAQRRAVEGTEKPVYRGGTLVGHTRDYSDSMLMFLLKAKYPEKYDRQKSERAESAAGKGGGPLDFAGARDALLSKFAQAAH